MDDRQLLNQSFEALQIEMDRHRRLVHRAIEGHVPEGNDCLWSDCPHRRMLIELALNSVRVLDETRKAFKSKQLEALRKDFLRVLTEETKPKHTAHATLRD